MLMGTEFIKNFDDRYKKCLVWIEDIYEPMLFLKFNEYANLLGELSYDCTEKFLRDVGEAINKAAVNKVIDEELADLLFIDSPKPGNIFSP